ncbi:MAG: cofactor-independent phosphoglycerate mutase [Eubacteriales bacterium]
MKYIVVLGDGMADEPLEELKGATPLEVAKKPNIDWLAARGELGLVNTIPKGMEPGSDTANLSVLGYNPEEHYTGRSPLEALSIGVPLKDNDISFRVNLVTLDEENSYNNKKILDHSAGEITTEEAKELIEVVTKEFQTDLLKFYVGTSYRHLLVWENANKDIKLKPPHDILGKKIGKFLPNNDILLKMMESSYEILKDHPVNKKRKKKGLNPANSIWFWGAGTKPSLTEYSKEFGVKAAMISAVDLLKGIACGAKMKVVNVEGATGTLNTNYEGKANAAIETLDSGYDFVFIHIEAPDECGHQGNLDHKIKAIELIDQHVVGTILEKLNKKDEDYKIMVLPDHPTPIKLRTHTSNPVPYLIYKKNKENDTGQQYNEKTGTKSGRIIKEGHKLMKHFLS